MGRGLFVAAESGQGVAQVVVRQRVVGPDGQHEFDNGPALLRPAACGQDQANVVVHVDVTGGQHQNLLILGQGRVDWPRDANALPRLVSAIT